MTVLVDQFQLGLEAARQLALFEPRYNIAPTQEVLVVREPERGEREAAMLRWGLIPSWSKEVQGGAPMINARGETVAEKPSFRTSLRKRRCLIPADGFYEWQQAPGASARDKKQPYYIHRRDGRPFAFAGLWESWTPKDAPDSERLTLESCTIVTTAANATLAPLHDRMPVILTETDYATWLDPAIQDPAAVSPLIGPCGEDELVAEPVSTRVNRVANDDPQCIEVQRALFE
jgi:putative SOS response-associated peptidase YedK